MADQITTAAKHRSWTRGSVMSSAPDVVSEPNTRAGIAQFFARLWKEKPLGTAGGIIIVLFILAAVFADVLALTGTA